MSTITIEVCHDGTITRACARTVNARIRELAKRGFDLEPYWSGKSDAHALACELDDAGIEFRMVDAVALAGADKARHTREVNKSRAAQARRQARKADEVVLAA